MIYSTNMDSYSIYLHIPFCKHRCAYCDFNTYAGLDGLIPNYTRALCREIEYSAASGELRSVHTVFFGGGTPSLLPAHAIGELLTALDRSFALSVDLEITLEANPGTLSFEYLNTLRQLGVNRLSLGMQSANAEELRLLEREHDQRDVIQAVSWARRAGFENLNLDLIFGLPYQQMDNWKQSLTLAVDLHPEHLSLYALTLEHGTPMQKWVGRGLLSEPDADLAAEMYEWAGEFLESKGYGQYEISNWARKDANGKLMVCRHNEQYWRCQPYLGFGAGAHGYAENFRIANVLSPAVYIERMQPRNSEVLLDFPRTPATTSTVKINREMEMNEVMMMGLRLTELGVSRADFQTRFGEALEDVYGCQISKLVGLGLLERYGEAQDALRLTKPGRLLGNQVFIEFV